MRLGPLAAAILLAAGATGLGASAQSSSPYAGLEARPIKALSAEQIAQLRQGRGMALALAAELNGWPGPMHVVELANSLGLTSPQRERAAALFARMQAEARPLGETLIVEEAALDAAFRDRSITAASLDERLHRIGALQGELRAVHLRAHLAQSEMLSADQIAAYNRLRGYDAPTGAPPAPARSHPRGAH